MIKLLGILVVAVGLAFRWNTLAVVLAAGVISGLLAGLSFHEIMTLTGGFFTDNRGLILPVVLMVPVVGVLERHGLQERVAWLIRRTRAATAGRVLWLYQVVRGASSVFGLSVGNHASMVRPLIAPMAEAAAGPVAAGTAGTARAQVRAHAAASENVGNFFSDDIMVAIGALLLIEAFFRNAGMEVRLRDLQLWSVPTAVWVILVGAWRYRALDRRLRAAPAAAGAGPSGGAAGGERT